MLESNVFRMLMLIGAIIVVGLLVVLTLSNLPDITKIVDIFFKHRLQKY